jgi:predicted N-formylglutamate amidohydrolase
MSELLEADEPPPVRVLRETGRSDFLLLADHAGRAIPRKLGTLGLGEADLRRHIAWDIGIVGVTERLSAALDATAIMQRYSRLVIDCNRPPAVASSIPAVSEDTAIPGNADVSAAAREARRREIFDPYHTRIEAELDARAAAGRPTVLVSMHSFTPIYLGQARKVHASPLYGSDTRLAHALLAELRREPRLTVGDNEPYAVTDETDYAVPVHGVGRGLVHTAIEIRQDLITDEAGQAVWAERVARLLPAALAAAQS